MSDAEWVDLGASGLSETSNAIWVQARGVPIEDGGDAPDFGKAPMMNALGVSARPAPATAKGNAQGVCVDVGGVIGVCIAAQDTRASKIFGKIAPGETALHSTGEGFDSQVLAKDQLLALVVGDDHVVVIDRKNGQIVINCPGGAIKVSKSDGVVMSDGSGQAILQLKDGKSMLGGEVILSGRVPRGNLAVGDKVEAELLKLSLALKTAGIAYVFNPVTDSVKAPGVYVGG